MSAAGQAGTTRRPRPGGSAGSVGPKARGAGGRRRGGRDLWKAAFFGVATLALVGGVAWALLGSSFFVTRSVQVRFAGGTRGVPTPAIIAAAGVALGTPLVRVDTGAVARRVEGIAQVKSARVTRSWPDAVVIWVRPRTAALAVPARGGYDLMDPDGVVLGWRASRPAGLAVLTSPAGPAGALRGNPDVRAAGIVMQGLPAWLRRRVASVRATARSAVTLSLRGGLTVVWGGTGRAAAKAAEVRILLRTSARYYDVSDPVTAVTGGTAGAGAAGTGASSVHGGAG